MFGKARDDHDSSTLDTSALDEFFGDEVAAENTVEISELRDRVEQVESQINSQFTSLATYAQIAQDEQRLTSLIERERADRITSSTGVAAPGAPGLTSRLDALEQSVALIQRGLDECRQQQKDLAVAITTMFDRLSAPSPFAPPSTAPVEDHAPLDGPISDLALHG